MSTQYDLSAANIFASGVITVGEVTLPSEDGNAGQIMTTNGDGNVSFSSPPKQTISLAEVTASYSSNIGAGDHIKFSSHTTVGSGVTVDTKTAYTTKTNAASLGRITLAGGKTYTLDFTLQGYTVTTLLYTATYALFDSDSNTQIGNAVTVSGAGALNPAQSIVSFTTIFGPSVNTRVEVRIVSQSLMLSITRAQLLVRSL